MSYFKRPTEFKDEHDKQFYEQHLSKEAQMKRHPPLTDKEIESMFEYWPEEREINELLHRAINRIEQQNDLLEKK